MTVDEPGGDGGSVHIDGSVPAGDASDAGDPPVLDQDAVGVDERIRQTTAEQRSDADDGGGGGFGHRLSLAARSRRRLGGGRRPGGVEQAGVESLQVGDDVVGVGHVDVLHVEVHERHLVR